MTKLLPSHGRVVRLLAALLLLALAGVPPLALAVPAASPAGPGGMPGAAWHVMPDRPAGMAADAASDADCHKSVGQAEPAGPAELPCASGCAACGSCLFVQAALLPVLLPAAHRIAFAMPDADPPALHLIRRTHPPLRPPRI
ncbi:hypothetical protein [Ferrovibrio sp.]|uniref:hypothetical protein n=1 Tax=Ferrovibrio sp. TaxID=1917215 RepID=UPI00311FB788